MKHLFDFDPEKDYVEYNDLPEADQYVECLLSDLVEKVHNAYNKYAFDELYYILRSLCDRVTYKQKVETLVKERKL